MPDLESMLQRLVERGVEFVIVGGYAAVAHGVTLVTQDMDVCCRFSPENLMRLQGALADIHPRHRLSPAQPPLVLDDAACAGIKNLYLTTDWGVLDCLGAVAGLGAYDDVFRMSEELDLGFGSCRLLTLNALITAKSAMNRPRDREAVLQLKAIRQARHGETRA